MTENMKRHLRAAGLGAILVAVGAGLALYFSHPKTIHEMAKPAETQSDGSIVVERKETTPTAKPKQQVPKGAKVERIGSVTAQGATPPEIKAVRFRARL